MVRHVLPEEDGLMLELLQVGSLINVVRESVMEPCSALVVSLMLRVV